MNNFAAVPVHGRQLTVTSLPEVLFSGGTESVGEGSVLWLYCEVNSTSPTLRVTWKKNNFAVVQDHPHLHIRSSTTEDSSTFILVLDYLLLTDSGTYYCTAEDGGSSVNGSGLTLSGILELPHQKKNNVCK